MRKALLIAHDPASVAVECSYCRTTLRTVRIRSASDRAPAAAMGAAHADRRLQWAEECPGCGAVNEVSLPLKLHIQQA